MIVNATAYILHSVEITFHYLVERNCFNWFYITHSEHMQGNDKAIFLKLGLWGWIQSTQTQAQKVTSCHIIIVVIIMCFLKCNFECALDCDVKSIHT